MLWSLIVVVIGIISAILIVHVAAYQTTAVAMEQGYVQKQIPGQTGIYWVKE